MSDRRQLLGHVPLIRDSSRIHESGNVILVLFHLGGIVSLILFEQLLFLDLHFLDEESKSAIDPPLCSLVKCLIDELPKSQRIDVYQIITIWV